MDPATLNALTRRWQLDDLGLDQEANVTRINARTAKEGMKRTNKRTIDAQSAGMADRGLARSGIAVKQDLTRQQDFMRAMQGTDTQKAISLAAISRKRLQAKADYDQARATAALGLGSTPGSTQ